MSGPDAWLMDATGRSIPLAYRGKADCQSVVCTCLPDGDGGYRCYGWHCAYCHEPCSSQGHQCEGVAAAMDELDAGRRQS